ncbi:MAG: helicase C-terminal domain-containing protein, partial [Bacteroidota bacterium]
MREIQIGVRDLLETAFHPKDLVPGASAARAWEGSEGHRLVAGQRPPGWRAEVAFRFACELEGYTLAVRGRVDGLLEEGDLLTVEEIKTTYAPLADLAPGGIPVHQAQLKLYLHFFQALHPGRRVRGILTYLSLVDLAERSFPLETPPEENEAFFLSLAVPYLAVVREQDSWRATRDRSLAGLAFPYLERRQGQDELMDLVAQALEEERDLFAEAATGIGKTVAVLYPVLLRLAAGDRHARIFFLTAKTPGKEILRATLRTLMDGGLRLRTVFIEAKERVCLRPGAECRPEECPCTIDYYARKGPVMAALLRRELMTPEDVLAAAREHTLCPFELSLDLALQSDLIVGDYNYVFDPGVFLRRFFSAGGRDNVVLVDEAHNLVARGREMYSADLREKELARLGQDLQSDDPELARIFAEAGEFFGTWREEMRLEGRPGLLLSHLPEMLPPTLERLGALAERFLRRAGRGPLRRDVRDFAFQLAHFLRVAGQLSRDYALYVKADGDYAHLRLFCLNPGPLLQARLATARTTVFFSATLSPPDYFRTLLGGREGALAVQLPSPFPRENRLYLHVPGVDTRYRARAASAYRLAEVAAAMVRARPGNYLMFFPSYAYLQSVLPLIREALAGEAAIHVQHPAMKDEDKRCFLQHFHTRPDRANLGLAILGGLFGEGVDLPGERLIGVCVVGPGLPTLDEEQE